MNSADEDDDIYSDLPSFKYHESLEKLQTANKSLQSKVAELEELVSKLTKENAELQENYKTLSTSMSSVYKTAQAEVKRKDKRIHELFREVITLKQRNGYRSKQKRHAPDSFNENSNSKAKKMKLIDSRKTTIDKQLEDIKTEPHDHPVDNLNDVNSASSPVNIKNEEMEAAPVARVPNISCPTLYSQRMFKKIYNAEPLNKGASNLEPNELHHEGPSSPPCNEPQSPLGSPAIKNSGTSMPKNFSHTDNRNTKNFDGSETNNNSKILSDLNSEKEHFPEPRILNNDCSDRPKNDVSKISLTENVRNTVYEKVLHNPMNKTLISLVMNMTNETEHIKTIFHSERETQQPQISSCQERDTVKHNFPTKSMSNRTDKNSENAVSEVLGLKLLNRPNKTTFCPISDQWSGMVQKKEVAMEIKQQKTPNSPTSEKKDDKLSMMEALFGSPLKWTENSTDDDKQTPKLIPPTTAYEDSCSAQIENSKFQKLRSLESVTNMKFLKESTLNKNEQLKPGNSTRTSVSVEKSSLYSGIEKFEELPPRPFEQMNFSALVDLVSRVNENSNKPLSSITLDQTSHSTKLVKTTFTSPKYNDSILGQFDDTTQLISALARDHSKISPIHTPIKESKIDKSPESKLTKVESPPKTSENPVPLFMHSAAAKKNEKKAILLEKPINILRPRKTPRIVSEKKTVSSKPDNSSNATVNKTEDSKGTSKESKAQPQISSGQTMKNSNRINTPSIKVSSVSNEVIKRVRAIEKAENFRKSMYENSRHKCKSQEKLNSKDRKRDISPKNISEIGNKSLGVEISNSKIISEERSSSNYHSNRSTSTKNDVSPEIFRREDRKYQVSHFKRPLSYYSHNRKNCRFRHSSVERKLIRDHRHSNRVRSTPVKVVRKHDLDAVFSNTSIPKSSIERNIQTSRDSCKAATDKNFSKSSMQSENVDSRNKNPSNIAYPLNRRSPFSINSDKSPQRNTHIRRSSRKIEWSATTSDVISTRSAEDTSLTPKSESKMKWFLQPIDFNMSSPNGVLKMTPSIYDKNSSENILSNEEKMKASKSSLDTSTGSDSTLEKNKSPNIVIIRRKRPVKFGVNEISIQCSPKNH